MDTYLTDSLYFFQKSTKESLEHRSVGRLLRKGFDFLVLLFSLKENRISRHLNKSVKVINGTVTRKKSYFMGLFSGPFKQENGTLYSTAAPFEIYFNDILCYIDIFYAPPQDVDVL